MTGGRTGNQDNYMKPLAGRRKAVENYIVRKGEDSVQQRMGKSQGLSSCCLEEQLLVVSGQRPQVRRYSFARTMRAAASAP